MIPRTSTIRNHRSLPFGVFLTGVALTALISSILWSSAQQRHQDRRAAQTQDVAAAINFRMSAYVQALQGVRALFSASDAVNDRDFAEYVDSLGVLEELPGMQAIGWNRLVDPADVAAYEAEIRVAEQPWLEAFEVRPIVGDELLVVEFVAPVEGNEEAFGFNILSEERRAEAFQMARRTNRAAATAPINLVQDDDSDPGILVLLPVRTGNGVDGSAVGVFRTQDLLQAAADDIGKPFVVEDFGAVGMPESEPLTLSPLGIAADPEAQTEIDVYGRRWLVSLSAADTGAPSAVGLILGSASGLALALALSWLVFATQRAAVRADQKATELTAELRQANEDLTVLGSRLERGIRSADVLVWESNLTTGATWSSADLEDAEAGIEDSFLERLHPGDRARVEAAEDPAPGSARVQEFRLADKHGDYRWILSRSHGIERGDDHVVIGAHIDITDQRARTELVERLNEDLTERNQALSDFTHVASHDLRSPLRAVSSLVTFLREDLPPEVGEQAEHHLRRIDERVTRMSQLIDDLLGYAKAHDRQERLESVSIDDVAQEVIDTLDVPSDMTITVDCDVPLVEAARTPLVTCVRNLVDNALKHHDKTDGRVSITAFVDDELLHLAVSDNGPGIDPDYLAKIFEPFRRLRVDEDVPGSGIGLSVIERTAAAHGGRIEVISTLGQGSTFTLLWPRHPAAAPTNLTESSASSATGLTTA